MLPFLARPAASIQNTDGSIGVSYLGGAQGNQILSFAVIAGASSWSVVGTVDMDSDGYPDLVIQNTDGTLGVFVPGWHAGASDHGLHLNPVLETQPCGNWQRIDQ